MNETCESRESCLQKMRKKAKAYLPEIIGAVVGGIGGFIYYYKVGCASGTCPITSNPWFSILWGILMGYLVVGIFTAKKKQSL